MHVVHIIAGLEAGGAEGVLARICTDEPSRHTVISLSSTGVLGPQLAKSGVEVFAIGMPRGSLTVSGVIRLWSLIRRRKPTAIQTWMYHADLIGGLVGYAAGVRNISWGIRNTDLRPSSVSRKTRLVAQACALLSGVIPRTIVCCAERARTAHIAEGYVRRKILTIPNGYDTDRFKPDAEARSKLRIELGIEPDAPLIGVVGRWDPIKGHEDILAALGVVRKTHPAVCCAIVGSGCSSDNSQLRSLVTAANVECRTFLLGERADVPKVMAAFDINVLASRGEGFPNVVAEAMAVGVPCIVTDVGDAPLIVGDTGWVVPPEEPGLLAEAILGALGEFHEPAKWSARAAAARQRIVDNFTLKKMVDAYRRVWAAGVPGEKR